MTELTGDTGTKRLVTNRGCGDGVIAPAKRRSTSIAKIYEGHEG